MKKLVVLAVILFSTSFLQSQTSETEPNNDKLFANPVSVGQTIEASFHTTTDQDYFKIELEQDKMYYLTSVENSSGLKPDLNLYNQASSTNLLQSSVAGRNGNNNFRLSDMCHTTLVFIMPEFLKQTTRPGSINFDLRRSWNGFPFNS